MDLPAEADIEKPEETDLPEKIGDSEEKVKDASTLPPINDDNKVDQIQPGSLKELDEIVDDNEEEKEIPLPPEAEIIEKEAKEIEKEAAKIDEIVENFEEDMRKVEQEMFEKNKENSVEPQPAPVQDIPQLQDMTPDVGDSPKHDDEGSSTQSDKTPEAATYTKIKTVDYEKKEEDTKKKGSSKALPEQTI